MRRPDGRPLVLGHRGSPRVAPENTLASFAAALDAGADGFELDVQLTADGELVVHHDPDVGGQAIDGATLAQLRRVAPALPTLVEVFELLADRPQAHLNIELKAPTRAPDGRGDGREAALCEALASWRGPAKREAWVSCFDTESLAELSRLGAELPLALLAWSPAQLEPLEVLAGEVAAAGSRLAAVHPHHALVTPDSLSAWRRFGLAVCVWTVNDLSEAERLLALGVDGLIGDDPGELVRFRDHAA